MEVGVWAFRIWRSGGLGVWAFGFVVWDLGLRVQTSGFGVWG